MEPVWRKPQAEWRASGGLGLVIACVVAACLLTACGEIAYLQEKTQIQDQTIRGLRVQRDQLQEYYNTLLVQNAEITSKYRQALEQRDNEIRRLQTMKTDRERELANLEHQARLQLAQEKDDTAKLRDQIRQQKQSSDSQVATLNKRVSSLQEANKSLDKQLAAAQNDAQTRTGEVTAAKSALAAAQERLNAAESERDKLAAEVKKLQQGPTEAEMSKLQKELQEAQQTINRLKSQLASAKGAKGDDPQIAKAKEQIEGILGGEISQKTAEVIASGARLVVRLQTDLLFESATVLLRDSAQKMLNQIADALQNYEGYQLRVDGHTDEEPVRTMAFPDNLALSSQRAENVLRFMMEGRDLAKTMQVRSSGCSYWMPVAKNDTPEGRRQNRRVEIILTPKD